MIDLQPPLSAFASESPVRYCLHTGDNSIAKAIPAEYDIFCVR
jgi:hypothetical protein